MSLLGFWEKSIIKLSKIDLNISMLFKSNKYGCDI